MDRDGTKSGFDIALTRAVADAVRVPVIASAGSAPSIISSKDRDGHATAVLAASIFISEHFVWPGEAISAHGIAVRCNQRLFIAEDFSEPAIRLFGPLFRRNSRFILFNHPKSS
jgi:hypothetical protein